jgi:hypothetical protein
MKCLLSAFMLRDRFFCLAASERFPLSGREAGIGAFLVAAHFPSPLTQRPSPRRSFAHLNPLWNVARGRMQLNLPQSLKF